MLAGYNYEQQLAVGNHTLVYRGKRRTNGDAVIIKILKSEYPTDQEIAMLTYEYEIAKRLVEHGVVQPLELVKDQQRVALVLQDLGSDSLTHMIARQPLTLEQVLTIAINLATALIHVHQQRIIHKDIKPANILVNDQTYDVQLIDFGISSLLTSENTVIRSPHQLEGTLAYMSPEQTGRVNRLVDYRSDFYSLGVTLYEMATGVLPFRLNDPVELVHAHIAKMPTPPHQISANIPVALSNIIMKLLAKAAEARYQSAFGLKWDLTECQRQWLASGTIEPFALGQHDFSDVFQLPQKLYGREQEIATLHDHFNRAVQGHVELVLIHGYGGIGKSSIVAELNPAIIAHHGYIASGKFDQLHRNVPYSALAAALSELVRQILTESSASIERWRADFASALGVNAQLMTDIVPELGLITGPQPPVSDLPVTEAQNRFNSVFQRFVRVFAQAQHPLVLFLDDLQWSDSASFALLQVLLSDPELSHVMLIGTYREGELHGSHGLRNAIDELHKRTKAITTIQLEALDHDDVATLVADALHRDAPSVLPLAELVWQKTRGNPFFINQFLLALVEQRAIWFDVNQGKWQWDMAAIDAMAITDNVVELMANKIQRLTPASVKVVQRAACIGIQFELGTLAIACQQTIPQTARQLWSAVQEGLIIPIHEHYKLAYDDQSALERASFREHIRYRFLHDRVRQAAYSLVSEPERQEIHGLIGRSLRQIINDDQHERLFDVVNHLNLALDLIDDPRERLDLAQLNNHAGQRAKAANAYALALQYFTTGIHLLGNHVWHQHDLALSLHTNAAEAAYLVTDFAQMQTLSRAVSAHARHPLEKTAIYELQISYATAQNQLHNALETARTALAELGVNLPAKPTLVHVGRGLISTMSAMRGKKPSDLARLPLMTDPIKLAAMRILMSTVSPAYIASPNLFPLIAFNMVQLSLKFGNSPLSPFGYIVYAILLSAAVGNLKGGHELGKFAFNLGEELHADEIKAKLYVSLYVTLTHWRTHLRESLEPLLAGFQSGLDAGDVEYTCHNAMYYCYYMLCAGEPLTQVRQQQEHFLAIMRQYKQEFHITYTEVWVHVVKALRDGKQSIAAMTARLYAMIPDLERVNNRTSLFCAHLALCQLHYWFGDPKQAVYHATLANTFNQAVLGSIAIPELTFYAALATLADSDLAKPQAMRRMAGYLRKLKKWAHNAPMNYAPKYDLVRAELARKRGQFNTAQRLYDQAIQGARQHGYVQIEALANELAARWQMSQDKPRFAAHYLQEARYLYQRWGAEAKISQFEAQFGALTRTNEGLFNRQTKTTSTPSLTQPLGSASSSDSILDLASVLKATQAITGEIVLPTLLSKLMRIMIENAGAQRGVLLIPQHGSWVIEAEGSTDDPDVAVLQSIPLDEEQTSVSAAIVNYVARLREPVVLANASHDGAFTRDPYVMAHQPKSIVCAPLLHRGELTAIVYLENNLASNAFAPERLELIQLLSGEAAISIENARLYANMEQLVSARTTELVAANRNLEALTSRLQRELALAHTIQQGLLPPSHPDWDGYDVVSFTNPVREVGGDFYAYHQHEEHYGVAVGDVSGKGMPAALLMAVSVALLRSSTIQGLAPAELMTRLNRDLSVYTRTTRQNCGLCYVLLEGDSIWVANAGGIPPLIRRADGTTAWLDVGGLPLGSGLGGLSMTYAEVTTTIAPNDTLILVSDGYIEASNLAGELFGFERFEQVVAQADTSTAETVLQSLNLALTRYIGSKTLDDDVTIVVIQRKG